ncbi:MAG TPA: NlpC/P60 family protein [Micromonosporaceae bacterium]|nr:NlpC/P60 family protein [Micromonosporaceae bacterium]
MSLGSLLAASEPSVSPGGEAVVCVGVATLWIAPDRVRPVDEPAVAVPSRPRDWIEEMTPEQREDLSTRALTQLLLGEKVYVEEVRGDWARVVALGQPTSRDSRGYPGWLPVDQLSNMEGLHAAGVRVAARHRTREEVEDRTGVWHVVVATATALRDDPDAALAVPGVTFGTRLMALGAPHDGWLPVAVPGRFEPAWAIEDDLVAVPPKPPEDRAEVLEWADRLRDVTYIWGGNSAYGVDCSGLVHLVWRRFGITLPRDVRDLVTAVTPIPLGEELPGDLYFFAEPGHEPHHVGFVAAPPEGDRRQMLHASTAQGRVVLEDMTADQREILVGAGRVVY